MSSQPLDVSSLAVLLLDIARSRKRGRLPCASRSLFFADGLLVDVTPGPGDEPEAAFVRRASQLGRAQLDPLVQAAKREQRPLLDVIEAQQALGSEALAALRRERLGGVFRRAIHDLLTRDAELPPLEELPDALANKQGVEVLPLLLDTMARASGRAGVAVVSRLNHRLQLADDEASKTALHWADFGELPETPAVSTILAKQPTAAPRIAALIRSGLAQLLAPGAPRPSRPPPPGTVPPPASDQAAVSQSIPGIPSELPSPPDDPLARMESLRPPRLRLDPGQGLVEGDALEPYAAADLPAGRAHFDDPLLPLEQRLGALERDRAPGTARAPVFRALADEWLERFASTERACRALREAAAADPSDFGTLLQTAQVCFELGSGELALGYLEAATAAASQAGDRAAAQRLRATICMALGRDQDCIEALCEAAADDPEDSDPHELVAMLMLQRANPGGASAHARLAAASQQERKPQRARALLDWAWSNQPDDLPTALEYASALDQTGYRAAAVAVLGETAARAGDPDARRRLRLAGARRAEALGRRDLAADLLSDAFDTEPHVDLIYAALDADLAQEPELRLATLENVAASSPESQRGHWLNQAGMAALQVPGQEDVALWLFQEAVLADPRDGVSLSQLRSLARSRDQLWILAHCLHAVAVATLAGGESASDLLDELGRVASDELDDPSFALAAYRRLERSEGLSESQRGRVQQLEQAASERHAALREAEARLAKASAAELPAASLTVAKLLSNEPEHWSRLLDLTRLAAAARIDPQWTRNQLDALYRQADDPQVLIRFLEAEAPHIRAPQERARWLARLASAHAVAGDAPAAMAVCEEQIEANPSDLMACLRLLRAARRTRDLGRQRRALQLLVDLTPDRRERSRALSKLARCQERLGDNDAAATTAAAALDADAGAADAALLLRRHAHRLEPHRALLALERIRAAMGDSRRALALATRAAAAAAPERLSEIAQSWIELLPVDADARAALLRARIMAKSPEALALAAQSALSSTPSEALLSTIRTAVDRLEELEAPGLAAEIALDLLRFQGRVDRPLAAHAATLGRRAGRSELVARALELHAAYLKGAERAHVLLDLAAHHAQSGHDAAQVRALLRALECAPENTAALDGLEEIFRNKGDVDRLLAVATLKLKSELDPERRRERLLMLIGLCSGMVGDRERAEYHARQLIAENISDQPLIRKALGALLVGDDERRGLESIVRIGHDAPPELAHQILLWSVATAERRLEDRSLALAIATHGVRTFPGFTQLLLGVERLTLAADNVATALATYDALIEGSVGPHGKRALHYRAGRWLELSGRLGQALERYVSAFELAPTGGVAFKAVRRLARETKDFGKLLACYRLLADNVGEPGTRAELLRLAAELCMTELGEPGRALGLLLEANPLTESFALDNAVERAARALAEQQPEAKAEAWQRVIDPLVERIEDHWDPSEKVRLLLRLANLLAGPMGDASAARERLEQARRIGEGEEVEGSLRVDVARARAELASENSLAPQLRAPSAPKPSEASAAAPRPQADGSSIAEALSAKSASLAPEQIAASPSSQVPVDSSSGNVPSRSARPSTAKTESESSKHEHSSDIDPRLQRALSLQREDSTAARVEARSLLRSLLRDSPWSVEALRALLDLSPADSAEHHVTRAVVSRFDADVLAPAPLRLVAASNAGHAGDVDGAAIAPAEASEFLGKLWEVARYLPHYRNPLDSFAIDRRQTLSRYTLGIVADAYAQVVRQLGANDIPVYVAEQPDASIAVVATHPPSVIVPKNTDLGTGRLRYELARALWLARPEHAIAGALPADGATTLLAAVFMAFAPSDADNSATTLVKELASALWQAVPAGDQAAYAELLRQHRAQLRSETLLQSMQRSAAIVALQASLSVGEAIDFLCEHLSLQVASPEAFRAACRQSQALSVTIGHAYSDALLARVTGALS
ncbi:MAG: hypothetical protein OEZ06_21555 [Myxococcales bacterium]|nr:hypothetical protein [Myxococcales bacterium]